MKKLLAVALGACALAFDFAVVSAYILIYHFQQGSPIRQVIFVPLVEAALRYGITGALALTVASAPVIATFEWLRQRRFPPHTYHVNDVTLQIGLEAMMALIVGWLVVRLRREGNVAETRAAEAERLRDQLGRRADVLEAANRCARALSSSLELEQAFDAFIREVRGLVPFDRVAIVLSEEGTAQVMAVAGAGAGQVLPPGSARPTRGTLLEELLRTNRAVYRRDMQHAEYPEEEEFLALGLRSRLATPLLQGARTVGMLSLVRREADAFSTVSVSRATHFPASRAAAGLFAWLTPAPCPSAQLQSLPKSSLSWWRFRKSPVKDGSRDSALFPEFAEQSP